MQILSHSYSLPSEVKCNCLILIESLAKKASQDQNKYASIYLMLESFLSIVFDLTLTECGSKDVTLRENVANAVYALIHLYPQSYERLIQQMISSNAQLRNDTSLATELRKTFDSLTSDITPAEDNQLQKSLHFSRSRSQAQGVRAFRQRFDVFVTEIIGLLRIK